MHLEPVCAGMCAAREDRMTDVVPYLQAEIDLQTAQFDDLSQYVPNARRFHETLVSRCGNESMILLIGSLELIWSAHESAVWNGHGEPAPMVDKTRRAALRDHQRLLDAIRDGNAAKAVRLAQDHLAVARRNTLAFGTEQTIEAKLVSNLDIRPTAGRVWRMTVSDSHDDRVLFRGRPEKRIATITLNNPQQRNSYDAAMREPSPGAWTRSPTTTTSPWFCCAAQTGCSAPGRT